MTDKSEESKAPEQQSADRVVSDAAIVMLLSVMEAISEKQPEVGELLLEKLKAIRETNFAKNRPYSMELVELFIKQLDGDHGAE